MLILLVLQAKIDLIRTDDIILVVASSSCGRVHPGNDVLLLLSKLLLTRHARVTHPTHRLLASMQHALGAHQLPLWQTSIDHVTVIGVLLLTILTVRRFIDLVALLDHFLGQDLIAMGLSQLVKFFLVTVFQVE